MTVKHETTEAIIKKVCLGDEESSNKLILSIEDSGEERRVEFFYDGEYAIWKIAKLMDILGASIPEELEGKSIQLFYVDSSLTGIGSLTTVIPIEWPLKKAYSIKRFWTTADKLERAKAMVEKFGGEIID